MVEGTDVRNTGGQRTVDRAEQSRTTKPLGSTAVGTQEREMMLLDQGLVAPEALRVQVELFFHGSDLECSPEACVLKTWFQADRTV